MNMWQHQSYFCNVCGTGHVSKLIWEKLEFSRMLTTLNGTSIARKFVNLQKNISKKTFQKNIFAQSETAMSKQVTACVHVCKL